MQATTISNCSNDYQVRGSTSIIPHQITEVIDGRRPKLYGSGENVRDSITPRTTPSPCCGSWSRAGIGETYLIGADGEEHRSSRWSG